MSNHRPWIVSSLLSILAVATIAQSSGAAAATTVLESDGKNASLRRVVPTFDKEVHAVESTFHDVSSSSSSSTEDIKVGDTVCITNYIMDKRECLFMQFYFFPWNLCMLEKKDA